MIKTVLLDLDDTILDFKMSERVALTKTLNELSIEPTEEIIKNTANITFLSGNVLNSAK